MPVARCSKAAGGTVSHSVKCGSVAHEVSGGRWLCHLLHAAVNCGQNRKPQCKMRQRSARSERRKAAQPSVASVRAVLDKRACQELCSALNSNLENDLS